MTIADIVFGRRQDIAGSQRAIRPLEPRNGSCAVSRIIRGNLAIALVRASPANILWRTHTRSKRPPDASTQNLVAGHLLYLRDQGRIMHGSQPDFIRKERCAIHVVVSVDRVSAVDERNSQAGLERGALEIFRHIPPLGGAAARALLTAAAATPNPTDEIGR